MAPGSHEVGGCYIYPSLHKKSEYHLLHQVYSTGHKFKYTTDYKVKYKCAFVNKTYINEPIRLIFSGVFSYDTDHELQLQIEKNS